MPEFIIPVDFTVEAEDAIKAYDNLDEVLTPMPQWRDGVTKVDIKLPETPEEPEAEEPAEEPEKVVESPVTVIDPATGERYEV